MLDLDIDTLITATVALHEGGIIAYPTEAVYGLGCDPFNEKAVQKLLALKQRPQQKGLILVAADWEQLAPLLDDIPKPNLQRILASWPGPYTWVFPCLPNVPEWLSGNHQSLAVRVSAHPVVQAICRAWRKPLVSTSANFSGQAAVRTHADVAALFGSKVDYIVPGEVGGLDRPTTIRDALTDQLIRQ